MKKRLEIMKEIRAYLDEVKIVDHHDHISQPFNPKANFVMDLPYFLSHTYLWGDLVSSGLPEDYHKQEKFSYLTTPSAEDQSEQRWKELKPYLEKVRNTIYYRYLLIALHDLFGFEDKEVDDSNWKKVSECIREKGKNHLEWTLQVLDKMSVHRIILDVSGTNLPNDVLIKDERLVHVVRMDEFIRGNPVAGKRFTEKQMYSLDVYLEALNQAFEIVVRKGVVGIKSGLAYQRSILYEETAKSDAERVFSKGLSNVSAADRKVFEDFMMHAVCEKCAEYNLPFQIHTGIQAGNYNTITNAKPTHLTNLFQKFPDVRFDLFHGGYPYMQEAGLLAKYFPNVYVDGCWLAHISPAAYKRGLDEWVEIVPSNKIFAWGGDHGVIDYSYASLMLAKDLISEVLAAKVASGYFDKKVALQVAERIMGENAIEVYGF